MTILEFLEARIDAEASLVPAREAGDDSGTGYNADIVAVQVANPRWLAECEAKRRIIELHSGGEHDYCVDMHRGVVGDGWPESTGRVEGQPWAHSSLEYQDGPCETLRLLAAPYSDHPDFDPSWRVEENQQ